MNLRKILASLVIAGTGAFGMLAVASAPAANAATVTCATTHSYEHSVTSKGTRTYEWVNERRCGKNYQRSETRDSYSYTGARSIETLYRNEYSYPHYTSHEVLQSWTKSGTYSVKVTNKSA